MAELAADVGREACGPVVRKPHGLGVSVKNVPVAGEPQAEPGADEELDLDLHERERVIELLLA